MSMVEKKKHLFVITLDNGKKTYFDFVDHNIYGVKILTEALSSMEVNDNHHFRYLDSYQLERKILEISYNYLPTVVIPFISNADTNEMRNYIVEDAQKIAFRYEHENWDYLDGNRCVYHYVYHYIQLCNLLHHERTYKNLYQSICMMSLIDDKLCLEYQKNAPLFFEDENFTILIPAIQERS